MLKIFFYCFILFSTNSFAMLSKPSVKSDYEEFLDSYKNFLSVQDQPDAAAQYAADSYFFLLSAAEGGHLVAMNRLYENLQIPYAGKIVPDKVANIIRELAHNNNSFAQILLFLIVSRCPNKVLQYRCLTGKVKLNIHALDQEIQKLLNETVQRNCVQFRFEASLKTVETMSNYQEKITLFEKLERDLDFEYIPLRIEILGYKLYYDGSDILFNEALKFAQLGSLKAANMCGQYLINKVVFNHTYEALADGIKWLGYARQAGYNESNFWLGKINQVLGNNVQALEFFSQVSEPEFLQQSILIMEGLNILIASPSLDAQTIIPVKLGDDPGHELEKQVEEILITKLKERLGELQLARIAECSCQGELDLTQHGSPNASQDSDERDAQDDEAVLAHIQPTVETPSEKSLDDISIKAASSEVAPTNFEVQEEQTKNLCVGSLGNSAPNLTQELLALGAIFNKVSDIVSSALSNNIVSEKEFRKFLKILNQLENTTNQSKKKNGGSHYKLETRHGKVSTYRPHKGSSERTYTYAIQAVFKKIAESFGCGELSAKDLGF